MSSEYDYNNNYRPEQQGPDNTNQNNVDSQNTWNASGASQDGGAYRMSGSEIPGAEQNGPVYTAGGNTESSGSRDPGYGGYNGYSGYGATEPRPNPMEHYNVTPPQPEKKKSGGGKRIIAVAIVCALIGGLGGGAAVGMALRGGNSTEQQTTENATVAAQDSEKEDAPTETASNINSTVIDVTTNSETTTMTPQDVYEQYVNAVVAISNEGTTTNVFGQVSETASSGSGFIITEDGYIVTNNHVVEDAQKLTVTMTSGEEYEATVIGADEENDVALIKIDATGLPTVSIGDSDGIEVGEQVCAIGNPLGELTNTLTVGYVSALDREINENGTPINMFQTDCAINSGNSGGPIFDMHGNVVGITTAKYSSSGSSYSASIEGIGFCIPINDAMDIVSDLLEYGYVKGRPSLGITCQAISSTVTQYYNLPTGIYVNAVEAGSAADNAGIMEGDIITAVDGTEVQSVTDFKALLKNYEAGDTATLSIYRSSSAETLDVSITFDEKTMTTEASTETQTQEMVPQMPGDMS